MYSHLSSISGRIRKTRFAAGIFLLLSCSSIFGQTEILNTIKKDFDQYRRQTLTEKLFVHTDKPFYVDGDPISLSKGGHFIGHHLMVPKEGVAIHINAFNFPVWGMLEKIAVNLLAGMPAI